MDTCDYQLGWRLVTVDGWPQTVADTCGQVVGVTAYRGADGLRHRHCAIPWHRESIRRLHPPLVYRTGSGEPVEAGDFPPTRGVDIAALARDFARYGQRPERVR